MVAARCSYTQAVAPVSAEMACTAPTWSVPGAIWLRHAMAYSRLASSSSKVLARIRAQTLRSGMYIVFVSGL